MTDYSVKFDMKKDVSLTFNVKFIPKLPKKSGWYLVCFDFNSGQKLHIEQYSAKTRRFYFTYTGYNDKELRYEYNSKSILWWIDINDCIEKVKQMRIADVKQQLIDKSCPDDEINMHCKAYLDAAKDYAYKTLLKRGDIDD